jgi:hypothetical protein
MSPSATASLVPSAKRRKRRAGASTREQAIADGHLIDVSDAARKVGFHWPVALTRAAFDDCVGWSEQDTARQIFQSSPVRLQSLLYMAYAAGSASRSGGPSTSLSFDLLRIPRDGKSRHARRTHLRLVAARDGNGEPVLTILLPIEN